MATVLDNVVRLVELFGDVATADPLSAALLAVGGLLMGATMAVFGYLSLGAVASLFAPP